MKPTDELNENAVANGAEISEDELETVSGGAGNILSICPTCKKKTFSNLQGYCSNCGPAAKVPKRHR